MSDAIDLDDYRLPANFTGHSIDAPSPPHTKKAQTTRFLKGPIPWPWLALAAQQPGRAFHVAVALWHEVGLKKTLTVKVVHARLREFGVDRFAARRGLRALEKAGLVQVTRRPGCSPEATLLTAAQAADAVVAKGTDR